MSSKRIVVLDDYEDSLRRTADWRPVEERAQVTFHTERLRWDALFDAIKHADAIVLVRDRTPLRADLIARLPALKAFVFTGPRNTQLDLEAMKARGIPVANTEGGSPKESTTELTWALILAAAKRLEAYMALVRAGKWRDGKALPGVLAGERLGLVGFGGIGQKVGMAGRAFGMEVVTWSPHMTPERAAEGGARAVALEELLATSKVVSLHLVPSEQTRKLLDAGRLATMRADSILVNTARSALIDMAARERRAHAAPGIRQRPGVLEVRARRGGQRARVARRQADAARVGMKDPSRPPPACAISARLPPGARRRSRASRPPGPRSCRRSRSGR